MLKEYECLNCGRSLLGYVMRPRKWCTDNCRMKFRHRARMAEKARLGIQRAAWGAVAHGEDVAK